MDQRTSRILMEKRTDGWEGSILVRGAVMGTERPGGCGLCNANGRRDGGINYKIEKDED